MQPNERHKLIEENMGLIGRVIKDKVRSVRGIGTFDYDYLFQIGCIGLCKAADTYKPGKALFSTYAYILIRNEIIDALEYATLRRNRETLTAPEELPGGAESEPFVEGMLDLDCILNTALEKTGGVTANGIKAIRLLANGYTHREIGARMGGASANNVSAWVARARKFLRSQPDIAALEELR
jgi:RNA polymerase sigma factor (sigma-70 family)